MFRLAVLRLSYDFLSITSQAKSDFIGARSALSYCHTIFAHILLLKNIFCFYFFISISNIVKIIRQIKNLIKKVKIVSYLNAVLRFLNLKRQVFIKYPILGVLAVLRFFSNHKTDKTKG
ncbi:hypothetical protein CDOMC_0863 [Campylobacter sp. RM16192]|nr:hypothetical protein CDOMC_0863 [Campylobacter sp. RM16192]